jgi:hypothetical protein
MKNNNKFKKLWLGVLFDAFGYVSFVFPLVDIVWAPLAAYLMTKMYDGKKGKIAAAVTFIEEALPFLDVIPTFTLMWLYTYVFEKKTVTTIIDV